MSVLLGMNAVLYRNTGTYGSPVWSVMGDVKDVTLDLETDEADVTVRGNNGWKATQPTLRSATIEFEMVWDPSNAGFTAIQTAFLAGSSIEFLALDQPVATTGAQGLRATMAVSKFSREEPLADAIKVKVTLKVTYSANAPSWWTT